MNFKHEIFAQLARVGKTLSNGNRLEILELLAQGERSVEQLSQIAGLSVANTSQHLQQLRHGGMVVSRKQGLNVFYRINSDDVIMLLSALRSVTQRHVSDVQQLVNTYLTVKDKLEAIPQIELLSRVRDGLVTVLDVRPNEEFEAGHIAGAINIPIADLEKWLEKRGEELNQHNTTKEIVAYCRGPYCILAFDAVVRLRERGYTARRLQDGFPEWKLAGLPIEKSIKN